MFESTSSGPTGITAHAASAGVIAMTGAKSAIVFEPLPHDDPARRCPDIFQAKRLLQWAPRVSLEEGLRRTITYFDERLCRGRGPPARRAVPSGAV